MTQITLRARLTRPPILIAPGVYDPFTALIAEAWSAGAARAPAAELGGHRRIDCVRSVHHRLGLLRRARNDEART